MLEILTGTGLAAAAGLNAYVPLLLMGIIGRLDWIQLPGGWMWLENEWVMVVLGILFVIEIVADKVPAVDSINDWIQTAIRPASGGIVFAGGIGTSTVAVEDPETFFSSGAWIPVVIGVVLALLISLAKSAIRPVANVATGGLAAPALSTAEDGASIALTIFAFVAPILVLVMLAVLAIGFIVIFRKSRKKRRLRRQENEHAAQLGTGGFK